MSESLPHDLPSFITRYRWRKTFGTALSIALIGVSLGLTWFYFMRSPSPQVVCEHMASLRRRFPESAEALERAVGQQAISGGTRPVDHSTDQLCLWFFTTEQKQRDMFDYGQLARCVTFAETPRELYPCIY